MNISRLVILVALVILLPIKIMAGSPSTNPESIKPYPLKSDISELNISEPNIPKSNISDLNIVPEPNISGSNISDPNALAIIKSLQEIEDANSSIDDFYSNYSHILEKYVDKNGLINYPRLRRHRLELLPQVLDFANLSADDFKKWPREEQLAFWINAYNFFALNTVTQNYPIQSPFYAKIWWPKNSIVHIDGFYDKKFFKIMGLEYNLIELERKIIDFNNPDACFAVCKATLGSPGLIDRPYRGALLEKQLSRQIKKYLSRNVGVEYIPENKQLYLSEIFNKNAEIFINNYTQQKRFRSFKPKVQAAFNFIYTKASPETVTVILKTTPETDISFERPNWRYFMQLNQSGVNLK